MTQPDLPRPVDQPGAHQPGADVLGDVLPAPRARRRLRGGLAVAGVGVAAAVALSGGGAQPEEVLPGDALAFVKLDLDPSAGQKLNAYRLATKFPSADDDLTSEDALRDDALRALLEGSGVDYDTEVEPWLGDRAGVAVLPSGGEEPYVVAALAYTDRDAAEQALSNTQEPVEFAFVGDYVLLSDEAAAVQQAVAAEDHLVDDDAFTAAVDALDTDQIALAWADLGRVFAALPDSAREQAGTDLDPVGQVVVGLRVEPDAVELVGRTLGVSTGLDGQDALRTGSGTGLAASMPAQSLAVLAVAGLGDGIVAGYEGAMASLGELLPDVEEQAGALGLSLPEDLATVLGSETALGVWGDREASSFLFRSVTDDPTAALAVLERAFEASGGTAAGESFADYAEPREDGIAVGNREGLAADGDGLGSLKVFTDAVPDADSSGLVLWVSMRDALAAAGQEPSPDTEPLGAFGLTASTDGADGSFRARLTFR